MSTPVITFKGVYKHYPYYHNIVGGLKNFIFHLPTYLREIKKYKFQALEDINFTINKGESVAIIGKNGSGKSTTLGMIAGVLKPNQGSVTINGRVSPLLELGGGFNPELTGYENIKLNGVLLGLTRKEVAEQIDKIVEFSELGEFIHHPIRTYSSGMYARLGFSVVAHLKPEILLIDEVLAVGDSGFQNKCMKKMKEFRNGDVTIVLVTHSPGDVENLCERVIWIKDHKVAADGPTKEILPLYLETFK